MTHVGVLISLLSLTNEFYYQVRFVKNIILGHFHHTMEIQTEIAFYFSW